MGSAALLPQYFGDIINILRVLGRTVVFDMVHAKSPTLNLISTMCQFNRFETVMSNTFQLKFATKK